MADSLRDQLAASFDKIVTTDAPAEPTAPAEPVEPAAPATPASSRIQEAPKAAPKAAPAAKAPAAAPAADDRPRDPETGQFLPKEAATPAKEIPSAAKIHPAKQPLPGTPQAEAALSQVPAKPRPPRPSSWKKEYWDKWEQLDPELAQYLHTRESQYAQGVSTYKAEAENAKPIMEAMQQFMPELQQHNVNPQKWITELGNVHRMLAFGSPQQKMATLANVARAYGVPLQAFSDQNAQQQFLSQGAPHYQPPQNPQQAPLTRDEAMRLWQEQFVQVNADQDLQRFAADAENHPHYDEVRETMAGLLQANLADDLESAYEKACTLHPEIATAIRQQEQQHAEEQRRQQEAARVLKAKGKAVSTASATPSGSSAEEKPKGLRSALEHSFDAVVGGGRV